MPHISIHVTTNTQSEPTSPSVDLAPLPGLGHVVTVDQLADFLQVPVQTVYAWNKRGTGPKVWHLGRHARYYATDIKAWLDEKYRRTAA